MDRFVVSCPNCGWESPVESEHLDVMIAAAEHLDRTHGPAVIAGSAPELRMLSFQGLTASALQIRLASEAEPEPEPPTPPAPERPRPHETKPSGHTVRRKG